MLIAEVILLRLTHGYFKSEHTDGMPFTETGAQRLKKRGICFIWIPTVDIAVSEAAVVWQDVNMTETATNFGGVVTGITLIRVSVIFRYGAELEKKVGTG